MDADEDGMLYEGGMCEVRNWHAGVSKIFGVPEDYV